MNEAIYTQRHLLVISGPSGVGKDALAECMMKGHSGIELSVSATTRPPRSGENHGKLYYYMSTEQFEQKIAQGAFLEYTSYAEDYYGTLKSEVEPRINSGIVCLLVIEVDGAAKIKAQYPECSTVFILAPDPAENERRLRERGESEESIKQRMIIAKKELMMCDTYDMQLVNDELDACAKELYAFLQKRLLEC